MVANTSPQTRSAASWAVVEVDGFDAGYLDVPQNVQDARLRHRTIKPGGSTFTNRAAVSQQEWLIPANADVAFPLGAVITLLNDDGPSITLQPDIGVALVRAGSWRNSRAARSMHSRSRDSSEGWHRPLVHQRRQRSRCRRGWRAAADPELRAVVTAQLTDDGVEAER